MNRGARLLLAVLAALIALLCALTIGPGELDLADVADVLAYHLGADRPGITPTAHAIIWDLRLPRALLAVLLGAALGVAGALTQGVFRNPLADPGILGISAGAALAAVLGFTLGLEALGPWITPTLAALGAIVMLLVLLLLVGARLEIATLLLAGVAIAAITSAITTLILAIYSERWDLGLRVMRWLMGSFEGRTWQHLWIATPPVLAGLALAHWLRRDLDALHLGADTARSLGLDLRRFYGLALLAIGLLIGASTAIAGVIGFIGLIVPHLARLLVGPGHRWLLPISGLLGALLLLLIDTFTRTVTAVALPPGVITSLVGGPCFLWVLWRHQRRHP